MDVSANSPSIARYQSDLEQQEWKDTTIAGYFEWKVLGLC